MSALEDALSDGLNAGMMSKFQGHDVLVTLKEGESLEGLFCVVWQGEPGKSKPIACGVREAGSKDVRGLLWSQVVAIRMVNEA